MLILLYIPRESELVFNRHYSDCQVLVADSPRCPKKVYNDNYTMSVRLSETQNHQNFAK